MAAASSNQASTIEAQIGPTNRGKFIASLYWPSIEEFSDAIDRAVSRDVGPNLKAPLPKEWQLVLPTGPTASNQLALQVSKGDANSFRNACDPPGILLALL